MNKKFIRVLGLGVGLFLAGSLSVNAQKVSFNGERLSLKQAFEKIESGCIANSVGFAKRN